MPARTVTKLRTLALTLLAASCTGAIGESGDEPPGIGPPAAPAASGGSGERTPAASEAPSAPAGVVGATPLRRLTRVEYSNTVRDLLGDVSRPGEGLPDDPVGESHFTTGGVVSPVEARAFMGAAKQIAASAVARLPQLVACDPARTGEDACARVVVEKLGKRAYRRPLTGEEIADLTGLYAWARREQGHGWGDAIRVVLQAMLQSPSFLYHDENGQRAAGKETLVRLTPHAVASRLSYFFWASMPDDALLAEADANRLATPEQIEAQARRLLADKRAADTVRAFHHEWLKLGQLALVEKDTKRFPEFTGELRASMALETPAFVADVFAGGGKLETLLTAEHTFVDARLGRIYGVAGPRSGLAKVVLDPAQGRSGVLTHLGIMAAEAAPYSTSPIKRGVFVREQLLCLPLPPPPPNLNATPPIPDPSVPAREQFRQHSDDPACSGCHRLIDPLGFAFEHFDAIGRHRATDAGKPVDATGEIVGTPASDGRFEGARQLGAHLARSDDVRRCVTRQWFRYGLRRLEHADGPSIEQAHAAFARSGFDLRELLVALAKTQAFSHRSTHAGEVLP